MDTFQVTSYITGPDGMLTLSANGYLPSRRDIKELIHNYIYSSWSPEPLGAILDTQYQINHRAKTLALGWQLRRLSIPRQNSPVESGQSAPAIPRRLLGKLKGVLNSPRRAHQTKPLIIKITLIRAT